MTFSVSGHVQTFSCLLCGQCLQYCRSQSSMQPFRSWHVLQIICSLSLQSLFAVMVVVLLPNNLHFCQQKVNIVHF